MSDPGMATECRGSTSPEPEVLSYAPVRRRRVRRRRLLTILVGAAALTTWLFLSQRINVVSLLPSSLLLRLQISPSDWLWQPATIELTKRRAKGLLGAAESTEFVSNTFLLEPRAPGEATQGRAFEFGLRITSRTPRLAFALRSGRSSNMEVGTSYHLEDVALTLEDGTPILSDGAGACIGEALPRCIVIGVSPHTYGWPVIIGECGRFNLRLSGKLMDGCPLSEVPEMIPFSVLHEVLVTESVASLNPQKATDLDLDAHIRSGFESASWNTQGRLRLDFGSSDYYCEVEVSARRSPDEDFVHLPPVLAIDKQTVQLPQAWLADPSWREGGSVELKATGGWTIPRSTFLGYLSSLAAARWRYWDSSFILRLDSPAPPSSGPNTRHSDSDG